MTTIVMQSNASGTGSITFSAPNTNTNRTLTLPDASGSLLESSNPVISQLNGGQLAGMRNKIINGSFDVWQRGVSSNAAGGTFTADRWRQSGTTSGTVTVERTQTTQDLTSLGYISKSYCLRWNQSVAASSAMLLEQRIEDSRTLAGKSVTLSFIARLNSGSFSGATVQLGQVFGTGGSTSVNLTAQSLTGLTTSFQRFTFNFTLPEVGTKTIGAGDYLYVAINLPTSGTWDFEMTGVQLEAGSVATPFEQRPIGTELALCQRYYCKTFPQGVTPAQNAGTSGVISLPVNPTASTVSILWTDWCFPVTMRATPSLVTTYNPSASNADWRNSAATGDFTASITGVTDRYVQIRATNVIAGNGAYIHVTANAEL